MLRLVTAICVLALTGVAHGASPALSNVLPRGGQRGTELDVTFTGDRLEDAAEVLLYDSAGLTIKNLKVVDAKSVKATIAIGPDAKLGEHPLRLRTNTGISELRTFWVGPFPTTQEVEPNDEFEKPQPIEVMNVTIDGVIKDEDVDYFMLDAKKGERISAQVEGFRLGKGFFDPYIAILNTDRFEVAACDDSSLLLQDPVLSFIAPEDGKYILQIRDSSYEGGNDWSYRFHVGTFPQPLVVSPVGAKVGAQVDVQLLGDAAGATTRPVKAAETPGEMPILVEHEGITSPAPLAFRASQFANVADVEPNNSAATGTPAGAELPLAFVGTIQAPGDHDYFKFSAKKDQVFEFTVFARRLRSPLDPVLNIFKATGEHIEGNDDAAGPDSTYRFTVPADGEYAVRIYDQLNRGGPEFVYQIEAAPPQPSVALSVPLVGPNSQERQAIAVPRGNRMATMMRVGRKDFGGDVKIVASDLPQGVTIASDIAKGSPDAIPVIFEAAADAPLAAKASDFKAQPVDEKQTIESHFEQKADLVVAMNQTPFYQASVDKLAVAVVEEVPFSLEIVAPKVPIVQGGSMQLKVIAKRKEGFTAPIKVKLPFNPPGISSNEPTIAESQTECVVTLNANGDAPGKQWNICALGSADANGTMWVSSPLAPLEVASPFVSGKIEMASVVQGEVAPVVASLTQNTPFEGKATVRLVGLPPNATTEPKEITSADTQVAFDVKTDAKTPPGQHKTLFCVVTVTGAGGEPIVHNIAGGGVLRVDAPKPDVPKPAVAAAAKPTSQPAKPLSRLEKLRLEAKQAQGS